MTTRSSKPRRTAMLVLGPLAVMLGLASASWACGLYAPQALLAVSPNRAAAPADVTVTGSGWQTTAPISLDLTADGSSVLQALGATTANGDGAFSTRVQLLVERPGLYYVSANQGDKHMNIPVEVTALGGSIDEPAWGSLGSGSGAPGLTDRSTHERGGSGFPLGAAMVGGAVLALCGALATLEVRRQRASS